MTLDWRSLVALALALLVYLLVVACTAVGTGRSTLVLAQRPNPKAYHGGEFEHLIGDSARSLVGLQGRKAASQESWAKFQKTRFGSTSRPAARIDVNVRDQTNTPPLDLFNIETVTAADVAKILTDRSLTSEQKEALLIQLRDNFRGMPESYSRLVLHGMDASGGLVYHYFPQVTVDLTGTLNSGEPLDRFDFLAAAIRIPDTSRIRFINFSPKAADLYDFTLGQLKQSASASANATAGRKTTDSNSVVQQPAVGSTTTTGTGGELNLGSSLSFSLTDELTRDLKSSLEARSAGILDGGRLFLIELRSNDLKRIAGTYSFNLMLEVPSTVAKSEMGNRIIWQSNPVEKELTAEVRVVGIVRHVVKPGRTGTFKRVPEPLNDETFREVVVGDHTARLWTFTNLPTAQTAEETNLTVFTNQDGASFTVHDKASDEVLAHGGGREWRHFVPSEHSAVKIVFHPVVLAGSPPVVLKAPDIPSLAVSGNATAIGTYLP